MSLKVGVCGLGIMGGAFAANLAKSGFEVCGYDPDEKRRRALKAAGGRPLASNADVARNADVLITSLASAEVLSAVVSGTDGLLEGAQNGLIVAEASTLSLADKEAARDALAGNGAIMLDTPVSGAGKQAAAGEISIMASGPKEAYDKILTVFEGFSKAQYHVGEFGTAMKLKLLINMLISVHGAVFAEAITLARASGVDLDVFREVLGPSAGNSRVIEYRGPLMLADEYADPDVKTVDTTVMIKDNDLIEDYAKEFNVPVPVFLASMPIVLAAVAQGYGDQDPGVITRVYSQMAGLPPRSGGSTG